MITIFKIILKLIYYPIGYLGSLLDYVAGVMEDFDDNIKPKN